VDPAVLTLALVAGAVAAFNPCGFALLPAYLSLLVASPPAGAGATSQLTAIGRAGRFTAGMTTGFVGVFGAFGLVVAPFALALERYLPVLTVVVGAALVAVGVWLLSGRSLALPLLTRRGRAPGTSWASQVGYGASFALASLSCTAAPFLAVTAGALRSGGPLAVVVTYVAYAAGMGAVVGVLALASATASVGLAARLRRTAPVLARVSGALLVLAGAYVAWYGWFELRVLAGTATGDPVVDLAIGVQSVVARTVTAIGAPVLAVGALGVAAVLATAAALRRSRRSELDIAHILTATGTDVVDRDSRRS
jgi:cytochrome c-type biogenesis protein